MSMRFAPRLALLCVEGQAQTEVELLRVTKGLLQLPVAFWGFRGKLNP